MNKKWRKPNNDCSKNWPVSTISFSSPKPPDRRRFPLRFMESLHAFFVAHWDQEPEIRKLFGIKPSVFRFMESLHAFLARIGTMNRGGFVAQAFEPAGPGDFPVARSWSTGLESPVNPQAGKPALQAGSWRGFRACGSGRLSSRPFLVHRTRKSGKPAGWKACGTSRFMERACTPFLSRIGTRNLKYVSSSESSQVSSGSW